MQVRLFSRVSWSNLFGAGLFGSLGGAMSIAALTDDGVEAASGLLVIATITSLLALGLFSTCRQVVELAPQERILRSRRGPFFMLWSKRQPLPGGGNVRLSRQVLPSLIGISPRLCQEISLNNQRVILQVANTPLRHAAEQLAGALGVGLELAVGEKVVSFVQAADVTKPLAERNVPVLQGHAPAELHIERGPEFQKVRMRIHFMRQVVHASATTAVMLTIVGLAEAGFGDWRIGRAIGLIFGAAVFLAKLTIPIWTTLLVKRGGVTVYRWGFVPRWPQHFSADELLGVDDVGHDHLLVSGRAKDLILSVPLGEVEARWVGASVHSALRRMVRGSTQPPPNLAAGWPIAPPAQ